MMADEIVCSAEICDCHKDESFNESVLPWDRFSDWLYCVCVVKFDLELGQALESIHPKHMKLSEQDKTNVCYLAFPDSNSGCMGDTQYIIRIRQSPGTQQLRPNHQLYNQNCPVYLQADPSYLHGFVYFRQVKNKSLPRGYFQKSIVILTRLPFLRLFTELCSVLAREFFEDGERVIEAFCNAIDQWPALVAGETVDLSILDTQVTIPGHCNRLKKHCIPSPSPKVSPFVRMSCDDGPPPFIHDIYEPHVFLCFVPVYSFIHLLWELVLTAEPIVVMASSPSTCSQMVHALISMIMPLMYCADYRPFFTIHDTDFKEYTTKIHAPPPVILGVTNPFFAKTLQHWPHIIRICESSSHLGSAQNHKLRKSENLKMLDTKPGVYTHYRPFLQKDKTFLKKVKKGIQNKKTSHAQTHMLRRHLLELTESFMIPLERYVASLMPLQKNISPYKAAPIPHPFNPDDFFSTLETSGPHLTTGIKGDWVGLYRRFFRSPNFSGWFNNRYQELNRKLQALQLEALSDADMKVWVQGKAEVEVVDMILKIRNKLEQSELEGLPVSDSTRSQLRSRMADIMYTLPDDLKAVLKTS